MWFLSQLVFVLGGNPPRLEGEVLNTQVVVQCPLSRPSQPTTTIRSLLIPINSMFFFSHLFAAMNFSWRITLYEAVRPNRPLSWWVRSGGWQHLKWNLLCFTYTPLPLSLSLAAPETTHVLFRSRIGGGEGDWVGWVASTTWHQSFSMNLSGLKWLSKTEMYLPFNPINIKHII